MKITLMVLCTLFGTLQAFDFLPLLWDTSDYKVLQDPRVDDYDYFADKCRGERNINVFSLVLKRHQGLS